MPALIAIVFLVGGMYAWTIGNQYYMLLFIMGIYGQASFTCKIY